MKSSLLIICFISAIIFLNHDWGRNLKKTEVAEMLYCPQCEKVYTGPAGEIPIVCPVCRTVLTDPPQKIKQSMPASIVNSGTTNLFWGVVFLVAGIIGYLYSTPKMDVVRSGWGQLAACLDQSAARQMEMWQMVFYGSVVAMVVGGILILAGLIRQSSRGG